MLLHPFWRNDLTLTVVLFVHSKHAHGIVGGDMKFEVRNTCSWVLVFDPKRRPSKHNIKQLLNARLPRRKAIADANRDAAPLAPTLFYGPVSEDSP